MGKIEDLQRKMQQAVDEAMEAKAKEVLAILEAETDMVRQHLLFRINQTFHSCGARMMRGYCSDERCEL